MQNDFLINAEQMKKCDHFTIETIGIPSMVLMERAALAVVNELKKDPYDLSQTLVICGSGNNGGDGFAIARLLHVAGFQVSIVFVGDEAHMTPETRQQAAICAYYQIPILTKMEVPLGTTQIVDAYLGIGAHGELTKDAKEIIAGINEADLSILSVDVPSGIDASTGGSLGAYVKPVTTVTFQFKKTGFTIEPGLSAVGHLVVADVGISADGLN